MPLVIPTATTAEWILLVILVLASVAVITVRKPVYSGLSFLVVLLSLSAFYLQLDAQFIAVMQLLVYAGAILVIFMFVIVLFQDAYLQITSTKAQSSRWLLWSAGLLIFFAMVAASVKLVKFGDIVKGVDPDFGSVEALGRALYIDFFFPFEAVVLLFLVALIGAFYIAKMDKSNT